jgi:tetratricopeptide (TPR) repeat protein
LGGFTGRKEGMRRPLPNSERFRRKEEHHPPSWVTWGNTYARAGRVREARECLRELQDRLEEESFGVYEVALIYAGLGEKDHAFEWLERAYEEHDKGLIYLKVDPPLDPLRSDPRYEDLLRRMNFPS